MTVEVKVVELQYVDPAANSDKFYRVFKIGKTVLTQYGRNGTYGTFTPAKTYADDIEAQTAFGKAAEGKFKKGYEYVRNGVLKFPGRPTESALDAQTSTLPKGKAIRGTTLVPSAPKTVSKKTVADYGHKVDKTVLPLVTAALTAVNGGSGSVAPALGGPIRPMLAESIDSPLSDNYFTSDGWVAQQKLDGERVIIEVIDGTLTAYNRQGMAKVKNIGEQMLAPFRDLTKGRWVFDGEVVGKTLWLFDMPAAGEFHDEQTSFMDRYTNLLVTLKSMGAIGDDIGLVRLATGEEAKRELYQEVMDANGEGIIFRDRASFYQPGKRCGALQKYKMVNEADCLVTESHPTKESVTLSVFNDAGDLIEVGQASTIGKSPTPNVGDVWEVRFLYVTSADNPRMVQPRLTRIRDDKSANECHLIQFKTCVTDKSVLQSSE